MSEPTLTSRPEVNAILPPPPPIGVGEPVNVFKPPLNNTKLRAPKHMHRPPTPRLRIASGSPRLGRLASLLVGDGLCASEPIETISLPATLIAPDKSP